MIKQKSREWFNQRKGRITGSNVGAILGVNPYMSSDDVLRKMVREYHGADSEFTGNVATAYGQFHEDGAIKELLMQFPEFEFEETGFHEFDGWLGASPDGFVVDANGGKAVLEIKCPYSQRDKNPPEFKTLKEQPHYYAQVQIEMFCTDNYCAYFYQWAPHGDRLEIIMRDQSWLDDALPKLRSFYKFYLQERELPYAEKHLTDKRKVMHEGQFLIEEYDRIAKQLEEANNRKKEIIDRLVKLSGGHDAEICGRKLTKVERKGAVSYAKVIKDHCPNVDLEPYRGKPTTFWKLS